MIGIRDSVSFECAGPRTNQEDFLVCSESNDARVFVLCDGMGGHGHGEVASRTVARAVYDYLQEYKGQEYTAEILQFALDFALSELKKADTFSDDRHMGTTLVVVAINRMNIMVGHVGDSRCYLFGKDGSRRFRTRDHSRVQEAVDAEILTEEEAWKSPYKNFLTRCVSSDSVYVPIEVDSLAVEDSDTLIICSDGVTDAMRDADIQSVVIGRDAVDIAECLRCECDISSRDNFSAIVLSLTQDESNPVSEIEEDTSQNAVDSPEYEGWRLCPFCGNGLALQAKFCPHCGKSVGDDNEPYISTGEDKRSHDVKSHFLSIFTSRWCIAFVCLLVGCAAGCAIGWYLAMTCV